MSTQLFAAFCLFSLSDYYIPVLGGRVFDYVGIVLLLATIGFQFASGRFAVLSFSRPHLGFLLAVLPAALMAIVQGEGRVLTTVAFLTGCVLIYAAYASEQMDPDRLRRQMGALILVNLTFFFLQFAVFRGTGFILDFHSQFGVISPRVFNEVTGYFRAAGLFQEPSSFSIMIFMLNSVRLTCNNRTDGIFLLSLLGLLLSESLWGFGAGALLLMLRFGLLRVTPFRALLAMLAIGVGIWAFNQLKQSSALLELVLDPITIGRMMNLENDPSRQGRFGADQPVVADQWLVFGNGISADEFQSFMGANGVSFYIYSFGLLGLLIYIGWLYLESKGEFVPKAILVLFAMSSYPQFSYAIWWAWLALLCGDFRSKLATPSLAEWTTAKAQA